MRRLCVPCLVSGADVNASDANGETALMYAAARGDKRTVQALLEGGPNLDLESKTSGLTAFKIAAMNGHNEIAELLKRAGARESR
jgi:ankyrin repeat protein